MIRPELVAERIVGAVESGKRELFVPRWYRIFALVQALLPGVSARLVARSGYQRPAAELARLREPLHGGQQLVGLRPRLGLVAGRDRTATQWLTWSSSTFRPTFSSAVIAARL